VRIMFRAARSQIQRDSIIAVFPIFQMGAVSVMATDCSGRIGRQNDAVAEILSCATFHFQISGGALSFEYRGSLVKCFVNINVHFGQ